MTEKFCSPGRYYQADESCLSYKELQVLAKDLNQRLASNQRIKLRQKKNELRQSIQRVLYPACKDKEYCWIEQEFVKPSHKPLLETAFRPKKPRAWKQNPRTWLNTYDILYVMQQYEDLYKDFSFLGVHPIDFQSRYSDGTCIGDQLCSFQAQKLLEKGKKRFAVVLNLDRHDQSGSHWVALYANLSPRKPNFGIYYYDSVAHPPPNEVISFMKQVYLQVQSVYPTTTSKKFAIKYNQIQKQFKNTECGMFSMVFLTQCLKNKNFLEICQGMRKDDAIQELRGVLYRPSNAANTK